MGHGVSHLRIQNYLDFIKKINGLEGNCWSLWIDIAGGLQKLGILLENEMSEIGVRKKVFNKKWSPKLIFLNDLLSAS